MCSPFSRLTICLEYPYRFQWRLPPQTEVNEGGRVEFEVEVEEEEAEVRWFSDDVELHLEKSRQDRNGLSFPSTSDHHLSSCLGVVILSTQSCIPQDGKNAGP